ncbi:MAG: hypothetical protein QXL17_02075 [Candidatus Thermoplasmatota archaeon]
MFPSIHPLAMMDGEKLCSYCRNERHFGVLADPVVLEKYNQKHIDDLLEQLNLTLSEIPTRTTKKVIT